MDALLKTFISAFFIILLMFLGASILSASIDARNADAFLAQAVAEIEESNCAEEVIAEWKDHASNDEIAKSREYALTVSVPEEFYNSERRHARASLSYIYEVPLIGFKETKTIYADIR